MTYNPMAPVGGAVNDLEFEFGSVYSRSLSIFSRNLIPFGVLSAIAALPYLVIYLSPAMNANTRRMAKNTVCLWYDKDAEAAARFYAETFPDSAVNAVHRAPADYPSGKKGDVLTVHFTVAGIPCIGVNGGPAFKHNLAFSFQIATDDQEETDRYWNAITGNGGEENDCGWCKDKWGISWQITPRALTEALAAGGDEARRVFAAMMTMKKIDIATINAARRGGI